MNSKKIILIAFILVALVQLYVPARMIFDQESILLTGTEYKFRTAPIDPTDPFRGKYITLSFNERTVEIENAQNWLVGETIYVLLTTDINGFAKIESVSKDKPAINKDFLTAKVDYVTGNDEKKLVIDYPFDRYYMEESKAYDAEVVYRESQLDTTQVAYALVRIKDGESALADVLIDGTSIKEIVRNRQSR